MAIRPVKRPLDISNLEQVTTSWSGFLFCLNVKGTQLAAKPLPRLWYGMVLLIYFRAFAQFHPDCQWEGFKHILELQAGAINVD